MIDGKKSAFSDIKSYSRLIASDVRPIIRNDLWFYPNGTNIDDVSPKIYLTQFGIKRWIVNSMTFNDLGFNNNKVAIVDNYVLQLFKNGNNLI